LKREISCCKQADTRRVVGFITSLVFSLFFGLLIPGEPSTFSRQLI
jgi:hypothetical protein